MPAPPTLALDAYVVETLLPDLIGYDRRASAFLVYLVIAAATPERRIALSHAQLAERTGLSRRSVQTAVGWLNRRQLVEITRRGAAEVCEFRALTPWRR